MWESGESSNLDGLSSKKWWLDHETCCEVWSRATWSRTGIYMLLMGIYLLVYFTNHFINSWSKCSMVKMVGCDAHGTNEYGDLIMRLRGFNHKHVP